MVSIQDLPLFVEFYGNEDPALPDISLEGLELSSLELGKQLERWIRQGQRSTP
jgi:hypothetical protein